MPTVYYGVDPAQINGEIWITSYTANTTSITYDVARDNYNTYHVRNDDNERWTTVGTGTLTARYNYEPEDWAFTTNQFTIQPQAQWVWNCTTNGTGYALEDRIWQGFQRKYDQLRVTQVQSALQQALAHADSMGRQARDLDLAEFLERIDAPDLDDESVEQVMQRYDIAFAYAVNARIDEEIRQRRVEEARRRAEHLLTSILSADQKREWLEFQYVTERAPSGRRYRVVPKVSGGLLILNGESNVRRATLCVHPLDAMPAVDVMVAMLLALRNGDEGLLLSKANLHDGHFTEEEQAIRREARDPVIQRRAAQVAQAVNRGLRNAGDAAAEAARVMAQAIPAEQELAPALVEVPEPVQGDFVEAV